LARAVAAAGGWALRENPNRLYAHAIAGILKPPENVQEFIWSRWRDGTDLRQHDIKFEEDNPAADAGRVGHRVQMLDGLRLRSLRISAVRRRGPRSDFG
jgi:glycyl-tRNA synthetase alpha subunit